VTSEWQIDIVRSRAPIIGAMRSRCLCSASDRLHRIRVTGPIGDQRSIRVAERKRMDQVGGQSVTVGLTRECQSGRDPHWSGCYEIPNRVKGA